LSVEILQFVFRSTPPGLVDWLNSVDGGVGSPVLDEEVNVVNTPLDVLMVDRSIGSLGVVPDSHPLSEGLRPVLEIVLIFPRKSVGLAAVIKAVLRAFHGVDVKEDFDFVLSAGVEEPLDLVSSAVHASFVRPVRTVSPVADGKSNDFDLTLSQAGNVLLSHPGVPMSPHQLISLLGSKGFTERVRVHSDTLRVGLSQESIEERRRDPGFEHHPSSNIRSYHRSSWRFCGCN